MAKAPSPNPTPQPKPDKPLPGMGEIRRQATLAAYAVVRQPDQPPTLDEAGEGVKVLLAAIVDAVLAVMQEMGVTWETKEGEAHDRRLERLRDRVADAVKGINVVAVDGETPEDNLARRVDVLSGLFNRRRDRPA